MATGARAAQPSIQGIAEAGFLTNETVFSLTELPKRLTVIGGGPIGCELSQAFQRLGSQAILFHKGDRILNKEDKEAAKIIQNRFIQEKIHLVLNSQIQSVEKTPQGKLINFLSNGSKMSIVVDEILVGVGRTPNVEGLNLEAVGVEYEQRQGVKVNDYLQTTNPKIYVAADICMDWKFTHAADAAARIVIKNTLFSPFGLGRSKLSSLVMSWVTYTDPEIAHVGMYEHEAQAKGFDVNTIKIPFSSVDRAIADGEEEGFVKIIHKKGSDQILGATIVSRHAGETISEVTTAIVNKVGLNRLSGVIHPYPTQAEAIKKAANAYRCAARLLTPTSKRILGLLKRCGMWVYWYNGKLIRSQTIELTLDDPALLYGATVFTTLRVYGNSLDHRLTNWQAHCDRLKSSLQTFGWSLPDRARLRQGAELIMAHFPVLRITVFPDGREWIVGRSLPIDLIYMQNNGIIAALSSLAYSRSLPTHKTGNYLSAWLAKNSAQKLDAREAILVDALGNWLETSTGNLWGWRDGCWWTPPVSAGILPGVMRSQLLNWLQSQQQVKQEPWTPELVREFEAIAYCNSVVEIVPIHTVIQPTGSLQYDPKHPCFQQLRGFLLAL